MDTAGTETLSLLTKMTTMALSCVASNAHGAAVMGGQRQRRRVGRATKTNRRNVIDVTGSDAATERKVVVVTGGAKGIGAACCRLLAKEGWAVVINHREQSKDAATTLASEIRSSGGRAGTFHHVILQPQHQLMTASVQGQPM